MNMKPVGTFLYTIQPYDYLRSLAQKYDTTVSAIASLNPGVDLNTLRIGQGIYICPCYKGKFQKNEGMAVGAGRASALRNYLRMLWEQHIIWTRLAIISMVFNLPDADVVTQRLLQNPDDFKAALKIFYGENIAAKFSDLLKIHLTIAAELVKSAIASDSAAAENAEKRWYENSDDIAAFLANINPYWTEDEWKSMLHKHLEMTKSEAVDMINHDYNSGVGIYGDIEKGALRMADVMAKGIVSQFPDKANNAVRETIAAAAPVIDKYEIRSRLLMEAASYTGVCIPQNAALVWAEGLKRRSAALQYTVMTAALKDDYARQLEETAPNWVTGMSSPWVDSYKIIKMEAAGKGGYIIELYFSTATSTGPAGNYRALLMIVNEHGFWRIAKVATDPELFPYTGFSS